MSYSIIVSRDSVRIIYLIAALKKMDIKMRDIGNAYLNAETRERLCFIAGSEWVNQKRMSSYNYSYIIRIEIKWIRREEKVNGLYPVHPWI